MEGSMSKKKYKSKPCLVFLGHSETGFLVLSLLILMHYCIPVLEILVTEARQRHS